MGGFRLEDEDLEVVRSGCGKIQREVEEWEESRVEDGESELGVR